MPESDARSVERFLVKIGMDAVSYNNVVSILAMPNRDVGLCARTVLDTDVELYEIAVQ